MSAKSCADCRCHRYFDGALRCEERRSNATGGVIVLDVACAKSARTFERVCTLVAARCMHYQTLA